MIHTVGDDVITSVKGEATWFVQSHGIVSDDEIRDAATASAERRIPMPRLRDSLLWRTLLWSSVGLSIAFGIAYGVVLESGFGGFVFAVLFVFILLIAPSWMIAFGAWGSKPKRAEEQRTEIRTAWIQAANRQVIMLKQEEAERAEAERVRWLMSRPSPAPEPQPYGVSPEGAERIVEAWMRHLGALDAEVT